MWKCEYNYIVRDNDQTNKYAYILEHLKSFYLLMFL